MSIEFTYHHHYQQQQRVWVSQCASDIDFEISMCNTATKYLA